MRFRLASISLAVSMALLGASNGQPAKPAAFKILGASVNVSVDRGGTVLPATLVPVLEPGDTIEISFPHGVQYSRAPRWHLIVADMYSDYLQHAPKFAIADADLSRAKAGYVWRVPYEAGATPVIFLVPEDGSRRGHGMPDARAAIQALSNRSLLLHTATLSAGAAAKASTMDEFLHSLASIQPGELADGRARVAAATQSLFGYDLGNAACFSSGVAQTTQYACAAQAVAQGYDSAPQGNAVAAVGAQLSVNTATYGMLIGAIYELLAKRRVAAHYIFIPGVIKPGSKNTNVFVDQRPSYDATAAKPSTIVYFTIGSKGANKKTPAYGSGPSLPVCVTADSLDISLPFSGLPVYFRSHEIVLDADKRSYDLPAGYDSLLGYHATLDSAQTSALSAGGTAVVSSLWGFDRFSSRPIRLIVPHPATWTLKPQPVVSGDSQASLTFTDAGAGMGSCVQSVVVQDAVGQPLPVKAMSRKADQVTVTLDAGAALGPTGTAVVTEANEPANAPVSFVLLPKMPQITSAIAYLPHGTLVLRGTGLKYIDTIALQRTGITFANGIPGTDGSWTFTATAPATYEAQWEHETMAITYTLMPPDKRTQAVGADVQYEP